MGRFFLFALLMWIIGNPFLAILVLIALSLPGWWASSRWAWRLQRKVRAWGETGRLRRELAVNPHNAAARAALGAILVRQGRFAEARAELTQVMPRVDDLPEAIYSLGLCLLHDGEMEKGRELVERALALNPKFGYGEPYLRLGDFRAERGEWEQAAECYRQATSIHTSSVEGWCKLGQSLEHLGKQMESRAALQEALTSYRTAPWYRRSEDRPWKRRASHLLRTLK
ncbi:MAG TPA: tetratricopeptide repeat protein [Candidatus Acidoferrum sp.]|nr:tetratricopeptide repeat protein [Candidatus Acidoferrum sp.]